MARHALICTALLVGAASEPLALANDAAASMDAGHGWASGTVLPDGTVLVITGFSGNTVEQYDPFTNRWSNAPSCLLERAGHEVGRLRDGGVVIGDVGITSNEFYDDDARAWTTRSGWALGRQGGVYLELEAGGLLAVTGDPGGGPRTEIERLMPDGGWQVVGNLTLPVYGGAVPLLGGDLLIAGGTSFPALLPTNAQRMTPWDGGYVARAVAPMAYARGNHSAILLTDGKVLAAGEPCGGPVLPAELYDPVADSWALVGAPSQCREHASATLLPNGKVYVAGGLLLDGGSSNTADIFDPDAGGWEPPLPLVNRRWAHQSAMLPSGEVLLIGGDDGVTTPYSRTTELYDPSRPDLRAFASLVASRENAVAVTLPQDDSVLLVGGSRGSTALRSCERWSPDAPSWTSAAPMITARSRPVAAVLADGRVLVSGGGALCEVFDPADSRWHTAAPMGVARDRHALARLWDGRVLAAGGASGGTAVANAELYDPGADRWSPLMSLPSPQADAVAVLLPTGDVALFGGTTSSRAPSAEVARFGRGTQSFSTGLPMQVARRNHTATLLDNGRVLVAGGEGASGALASAELYDPDGGTWTQLPPMVAPRTGHVAVLLQNGKVLLAGGDDAGTTELYAIVPNAFRPGPPLPAPVAGMAATKLPDHRVLLVGGAPSGGGSSQTTSVFDEGRGASPSWTPSLDAPPSAAPGGTLRLSGALFTGVSPGTATKTNMIPANLPLLTARASSGADERLRVAMWDSTNALTAVPAQWPIGPYALTVTVNGVPSASRTLWVGGQNGDGCSAPAQCLSGSCDGGTCWPGPRLPAAGFCSPWCDVGCDCSSGGAGATAIAVLILGVWRRSHRQRSISAAPSFPASTMSRMRRAST